MGLTNLTSAGTSTTAVSSTQILSAPAQQLQTGIQVAAIPSTASSSITSLTTPATQAPITASLPTTTTLADANAVLPIQFPTSTPGVMQTVHVPLQSLQSALQSTGQTLTLPSGYITEAKIENVDDNNSQVTL